LLRDFGDETLALLIGIMWRNKDEEEKDSSIEVTIVLLLLPNFSLQNQL